MWKVALAASCNIQFFQVKLVSFISVAHCQSDSSTSPPLQFRLLISDLLNFEALDTVRTSFMDFVVNSDFLVVMHSLLQLICAASKFSNCCAIVVGSNILP